MSKEIEITVLKFYNLVSLYEETIRELDDPNLFVEKVCEENLENDLFVKKWGELYFKKIENLPFYIRVINCLKAEQIFYLGELVQKTERELLWAPNFGRKSLNDVKYVLKEMGLTLGMKVPPVEHAMRPFLHTIKSKLQSVLNAIEAIENKGIKHERA